MTKLIQGVPPCQKQQLLVKLYNTLNIPQHTYKELKEHEKKEIDGYLKNIKKLLTLKNLVNIEIPEMPNFLKKIKQVEQDAHNAFSIANLGGFEFRQLTGRQQGELLDYLEKLTSILKGNIYLRELPPKPKFLK
jgi:hypothetical protein